mgnify:CR=1 FL=1
MKNNMPRTPFSTPLSGSARETEIRIRNIMSGPKKRPPVLFLALVFSVCIFCGNLVSCQVVEAEGNPPETPDTSVSVSVPPDVSQPEGPAWTPVELDAGMMKYVGQTGDWFYENYFPTEKEMALLENLPRDELPREAVEVYQASRRDYWRDALLPVAYDQGADVTSIPTVCPMWNPWLPFRRGRLNSSGASFCATGTGRPIFTSTGAAMTTSAAIPRCWWTTWTATASPRRPWF